MQKAAGPERMKIQTLWSIRLAKFCSHLFMAKQAVGQAITLATNTPVLPFLIRN